MKIWAHSIFSQRVYKGIPFKGPLPSLDKVPDRNVQGHWYSSTKGLECSKRPENIINRKNTFFYIEAIPPKFPQLRQKIFFRARQKIICVFFTGIWGFSKDFLIKPLYPLLYKGFAYWDFQKIFHLNAMLKKYPKWSDRAKKLDLWSFQHTLDILKISKLFIEKKKS